MTLLTLALVLFVGSHFVLSHPLRAPLVRVVGEGGFAILYSVIAFGTLGWAVAEWRRAPVELLWTAPDALWWVAALLMLIASVLFVGSMTAPNPALMGAGGRATAEPRGVQRITRHPMMWAFAIWAAVHAWLGGDEATLILCAAIAILALGGAAAQDVKKDALAGLEWAAYRAQTSYLPFGLRFVGPGSRATLFGVALLTQAADPNPSIK